TALLTSNVLLVPYSAHHVPTYHEWMQDADLQALTASEPLTLTQEHSMQKSWRTDADKLTFITCRSPFIPTIATAAPPPPPSTITAGEPDTPQTMIGDINLFLTPCTDSSPSSDEENKDAQDTDDENPHAIVGEIEIMIADPLARGQGLGKEILLTFLWYILSSAPRLMDEYDHQYHQKGKRSSNLHYLRVKIDQNNTRSVRLFETVGFVKVSEKANFFGEVELR
ncbi:hypothetical protein P280DRAFT_356513, partial [Massarina eburnea CBS 473.64]